MAQDVFKAVQITDTVWWVGAIDWTIRDFHGYLTSRGTTYNAYLVMADKITLIDTVKKPFKEELLARIASVVDPSEIDIIVSNHSEMDHSGCLREIIDVVKPSEVYASAMGVKALASHFGEGLPVTAVENGGKVDLGNREIQFLETRMLHWPDSMFSYLPDERVLFSQDAFGMHLASYDRFADEIDEYVLDFEGSKYFANILLPYSQIIPKAIEKTLAAGIDPAIVAPDHGPVWREPEDIKYILDCYAEWSAQKPQPKAVVLYDTMWGSTEKMARAICEGLHEEDIDIKLMSLRSAHRSDVITELLDAGALITGSPTINNNLFPTLADCLSYVKGLKPRNLTGAVFGSYGWSGESVKQLEALYDEMKIKRVADSVRVEYVPDQDSLAGCVELGRTIGKTLNGSSSNE